VAEKAELLRTQLGLEVGTVAAIIEQSSTQLGLDAELKGVPLVAKADACLTTLGTSAPTRQMVAVPDEMVAVPDEMVVVTGEMVAVPSNQTILREPQPPTTAREFRLTITATRGGPGICCTDACCDPLCRGSPANWVQFSTFKLYDSSGLVQLSSCSNPGGAAASGGETASSLIRNDGSKWIDLNFRYNGSRSVLEFHAPRAVTPIAYELITGNDGINRDPVSWTLEAKHDGAWQPLDTQERAKVPLSRNSPTGRFPLDRQRL